MTTTIKKKTPIFTSYAKGIKKARSLNEISGLYTRIKLCNAAVGDFDFRDDYDFYDAMVKGHANTAIVLCSKRFKNGKNSSAKNLKGDKWKEARVAYNKAYRKWIKKNKVIYPYPKHFVGIKKGVAIFSTKKPKTVKNPFGTKSRNKHAFE